MRTRPNAEAFQQACDRFVEYHDNVRIYPETRAFAWDRISEEPSLIGRAALRAWWVYDGFTSQTAGLILLGIKNLDKCVIKSEWEADGLKADELTTYDYASRRLHERDNTKRSS